MSSVRDRAGRPAHDRRLVLAALVAAFAVMMLTAAGANGASLAQVRKQLVAWKLRPGPLFPTSLPAGYEGANVTLDRFSGIDYDVTFARPDCSGTNFCAYYRRLPWGALDDILHDSATTYVEPMQIGTRNGYAAETGHAGAPSLFAWRERGRTYMAVERYVDLTQAIQDFTPLIESLQPLPTAPLDPCAQRWANGRSVRRKGGRLVYDRPASLLMVCHGFGTDTGGLHVQWLTWGMQCALVATAIGARYGESAEFLANGACTVAEIRRHPGLVTGIGAACSTASNLLGLKLKKLGEISGLACEAAPALGTGIGTSLESHHEFRVARDVLRKRHCLEYRQYLGVSSWHAVGCATQHHVVPVIGSRGVGRVRLGRSYAYLRHRRLVGPIRPDCVEIAGPGARFYAPLSGRLRGFVVFGRTRRVRIVEITRGAATSRGLRIGQTLAAARRRYPHARYKLDPVFGVYFVSVPSGTGRITITIDGRTKRVIELSAPSPALCE